LRWLVGKTGKHVDALIASDKAEMGAGDKEAEKSFRRELQTGMETHLRITHRS